MQQHGFARNLDWEISNTNADLQPDERDPTVELVLTDNDYTRAMWSVTHSCTCCRTAGCETQHCLAKIRRGVYFHSLGHCR